MSPFSRKSVRRYAYSTYNFWHTFLLRKFFELKFHPRTKQKKAKKGANLSALSKKYARTQKGPPLASISCQNGSRDILRPCQAPPLNAETGEVRWLCLGGERKWEGDKAQEIPASSFHLPSPSKKIGKAPPGSSAQCAVPSYSSTQALLNIAEKRGRGNTSSSLFPLPLFLWEIKNKGPMRAFQHPHLEKSWLWRRGRGEERAPQT